MKEETEATPEPLQLTLLHTQPHLSKNILTECDTQINLDLGSTADPKPTLRVISNIVLF